MGRTLEKVRRYTPILKILGNYVRSDFWQNEFQYKEMTHARTINRARARRILVEGSKLLPFISTLTRQ